jgi:hypothetical protein
VFFFILSDAFQLCFLVVSHILIGILFHPVYIRLIGTLSIRLTRLERRELVFDLIIVQILTRRIFLPIDVQPFLLIVLVFFRYISTWDCMIIVDNEFMMSRMCWIPIDSMGALKRVLNIYNDRSGLNGL